MPLPSASRQHAAPVARPAHGFDAVLAAPFGRLGVRVDGERLTSIVFLRPDTPLHAADAPAVQRLALQLAAYFDDPDAAFDVPLATVGTAFQQRVWQAIAAVPRGRTATYGELASSIGGTARAVGQACGDNPFPLVVPCHRVVGAKGLGGFAHHGDDGFHLDVKRWLLRHERVMLL
ncbi:methylated-DNA-[protein]-cysteine S-methyltransferase [Cupriavidus gilardii J11]|uniref:methylated-DNA--[protein]-cysteine S-methyltransferase n=1 Tax=Cupriavidus gilardii J11 TaxID=936133 RepID=A0A562BM81_9BURK|nr:methylated-DNA--[protein]-cysteine S-methyltransferase [Cupriavidus gilardii]TWG86296.1 methylated-DNA-[protein]-cysteine S-methyltransferase [Cupriavidus gilardii J11]